MRRAFPAVVLLALACMTSFARAQDLSELSLEELAEVPLLVVEKSPERIFDAPVGSYIFDRNAIESLPVDSIPEMLRYAPGVHIMRPTNGIWGVGIRGMNSRFTNRVLFTVDEQNIYGSLFTGFFGNEHDLILDDIASVEVVYGPGGSLWNNNAVNGMVNVVMKSAFETEDSILHLSAGSESRRIISRTGWKIDEDTSARVYAKVQNRDPSGSSLYDDTWETARLGFHADHRTSASGLLSFSADAFSSDLGYAVVHPNLESGGVFIRNFPEKQYGATLQARIARETAKDEFLKLSTWFGYADIDAAYINGSQSSLGLQFDLKRPLGDRSRIQFRSGLTLKEDRLHGTHYVGIDESEYDECTQSAFAGFEYATWILPDKLELELGLNANYNSFQDFDSALPNVNAVYHLSETQRIWTSFSRADRPISQAVAKSKPILFANGIQSAIENIPPYIIHEYLSVALQALTNSESRYTFPEELTAFEAGYRKVFQDRGSLSVTGFYYHYDHLFGPQIELSPAPPGQSYPDYHFYIDNASFGYSYGAEASLDWNFTQSFRASLNYAIIRDNFLPLEMSAVEIERIIEFINLSVLEGNVPTHQASLWLSKSFDSDISLNLGLRYSSAFANINGNQPSIFQADASLSYQVSDSLKLSLSGRNLLDSRTDEALLNGRLAIPSEILREVSLDLSLSF